MNQNHYSEPLSTNGHKKSFLLLVGWVFGASCLSVPYNLYWKLGNGLLAVNILITLILAAAGAILVTASIRLRQRHSVESGSMLKGWFRSAWKCNGLFWVIVFLLLVFSDIYVLFGVETDNAVELIGSSLGRLATQAASVLCLLFVFKFVLGMTPKPLRAIVILVFSLSPILVVTDFLLKQYWNHS
ncbi:MAG: hypothetical protein GWP42_05520, partial [Verrucomicrobiales bacterium]|nr:hypothetical protein [Verrucomicrobiales bacterium]